VEDVIETVVYMCHKIVVRNITLARNLKSSRDREKNEMKSPTQAQAGVHQESINAQAAPP
jgi:hypothetical protein